MISKRYVFIITIILLSSLSSILNNVPGPIVINNNDILKPGPNNINQSKSNPLNTTTVYNGETVYVTIDNGTNVHIPTTYTYNSINNITHNITFYDVGGVDDFCFYTPNHWNFTLDGSAETMTYNVTGNCWIYTHTGGAEYDTFLFLSGETYGVGTNGINQYYPIEEYNILNDSDFETDYTLDWLEEDSFDSIGLNTSVYSNNESSLKLYSNDVDTNNIYCIKDIPEDYYIISFRIFVERWDSGFLRFSYYNYDEFINNTIDTTIVNKFQVCIYSIQVDSSSINGESVRFEFVLGNGTIFIDQFQIYSITPNIINTNTINSFNISLSYISLDTLQNFNIYNIEFNLSLVLRNSNNTVTSWLNYTSVNGYYSILYENELSNTEYELRTFHSNATVTTEAEYDYGNNLTLLARCEEGAGTFMNDTSGNGYNGSFVNSPTWESETGDLSDYSIDYDDGQLDHIVIGDESDLSFTDGAGTDESFSISAWVYIDSFGVGTLGVASKYGTSGNREWIFYVTDEGHFDLFLTTSTGAGYIYKRGSGVTVNSWFWLVAVYDGSEVFTGITMYLNTAITSTGGGSSGYSGMSNTGQDVWIGRYDTNYMEGNIDDIVIHNRALSQEEITSYYTFMTSEPINPSSSISKYIQPRIITEKYYSYEKLNDSIDFLESNKESFTVGGDDSLYISEGNIHIQGNGFQTALGLTRSSLDIDTEFYNKLKMRYKFNGTNLGNGYDIYIRSTGLLVVVNDLNSIINNDTWIDYEVNLITNWLGIQSQISMHIRNSNGITDIPNNASLWIDYLEVYHEDDINVWQSNTEYYIASDNNTLTYSSVLNSITSVFNDQSWQTISSNGIYNMSYTAYNDSNYDTLLLPSDTYYYSLVLTQPNNNLATNLLLMGIQEFIMIFGIIALTMYLMYRVFRKLFKL